MLKAVALAYSCYALSKVCQRQYWVNAINFMEAKTQYKFPREGVAHALDAQSYDLGRLAKEKLCELPLLLLDYHWQCWLERMLPTRPPGSGLTAQEQEKITEGDEMVEEEMMRRLIAKGKVRRASISWCNLFLKWVLESTIAALVLQSLFTAMWGTSESYEPRPGTAGLWYWIIGVCLTIPPSPENKTLTWISERDWDGRGSNPQHRAARVLDQPCRNSSPAPPSLQSCPQPRLAHFHRRLPRVLRPLDRADGHSAEELPERH